MSSTSEETEEIAFVIMSMPQRGSISPAQLLQPTQDSPVQWAMVIDRNESRPLEPSALLKCAKTRIVRMTQISAQELELRPLEESW